MNVVWGGEGSYQRSPPSEYLRVGLLVRQPSFPKSVLQSLRLIPLSPFPVAAATASGAAAAGSSPGRSSQEVGVDAVPQGLAFLQHRSRRVVP